MAGEAQMQTSVGILKKIFQVLSNDKNSIGHEVLTVTTGSLGFASIPAGATQAIFQVESNISDYAIRYWEDGSAPTSSVGFFQGNNAVVELTTAENIKNFRVIQGSAGTTKLNISYYK